MLCSVRLAANATARRARSEGGSADGSVDIQRLRRARLGTSARFNLAALRPFPQVDELRSKGRLSVRA